MYVCEKRKKNCQGKDIRVTAARDKHPFSGKKKSQCLDDRRLLKMKTSLKTSNQAGMKCGIIDTRSNDCEMKEK